jgi:hypothetical protein
MKSFANNIFFVIIYLLGVTIAFAAPNPPSPGGKKPPSPPGLPIDENFPILFIMTILFGIYIIHRYQLKTKAPI